MTKCTCAAVSIAVLVVAEIVAVRAAATVVECHTVFTFSIIGPSNLSAVAVALGYRQEAVSWRVGVAMWVIHGRGTPVIALISCGESIVITATATVCERTTLGVVRAPVELQNVVIAWTSILRQLTQLCVNNNK